LCFDLDVPIKTSSEREVASLIARLEADNALEREAAIARLTIIGTRAIGRLVDVLESTRQPPARAATLRVLEGIGDSRALDPILVCLSDSDSDVAIAAVSAASAFLKGPHGADVLDRLMATALATGRPQLVRMAAIDALAGLDSVTLKPLWKRLSVDPVPALRSRAEAAGRAAVPDASRMLAAACEGELTDASALRQAVVGGGSAVALPMLCQIIERIREREASLKEPRRSEWTKTRAAAHLTLAQRGSRLALYDLRESLESATAPLPVEFLAALSEIGDASCVEPIAAAYVRSIRAGASSNDWWRQHLVAAFRAIVKNERLTKRHAVMKKIVKRWGSSVGELVG
jgi:HEAT repeat protein